MTDLEQLPDRRQQDELSFLARLLAGEYGLATTYWALYFIGVGTYFVLGSVAVGNEQWFGYLVLVAVIHDGNGRGRRSDRAWIRTRGSVIPYTASGWINGDATSGRNRRAVEEVGIRKAAQ